MKNVLVISTSLRTNSNSEALQRQSGSRQYIQPQRISG